MCTAFVQGAMRQQGGTASSFLGSNIAYGARQWAESEPTNRRVWVRGRWPRPEKGGGNARAILATMICFATTTSVSPSVAGAREQALSRWPRVVTCDSWGDDAEPAQAGGAADTWGVSPHPWQGRT